MADTIRVGVLWGSLRKDSMNKKLAKFVASKLSELDGIEIDEINLAELDLPMYNEDISPMPASVHTLRDQMIACDALIVTSPEYNGSISGALKNAIDWASVGRDGDAPRACFQGKVVGMLASSPGGLGGLRGMRHVRQILTQLHSVVVPAEYALGAGHEAFDENGNMKDDTKAELAMQVAYDMVRVCRALKSL